MFGEDKNTRKSIDAVLRLNGFYMRMIQDLDGKVYGVQNPFFLEEEKHSYDEPLKFLTPFIFKSSIVDSIPVIQVRGPSRTIRIINNQVRPSIIHATPI